MEHTFFITVLGVFALAYTTVAQPRSDAALFAAAHKALPRSLSTNEISRALDTDLWNSNKTAVAICFTNLMASTAFVFLNQAGGKYAAVDVSAEGLGLGFIGDAPRSAYQKLELTPIRWLHRDDGMFQLLHADQSMESWSEVHSFKAPAVPTGCHSFAAVTRMPNQRVERTAAERLGFDTIGFMNIIRHSLSARSAAVAHSCR